MMMILFVFFLPIVLLSNGASRQYHHAEAFTLSTLTTKCASQCASPSISHYATIKHHEQCCNQRRNRRRIFNVATFQQQQKCRLQQIILQATSSSTTPPSSKNNDPTNNDNGQSSSLPWRQSLKLGFQTMLGYIALRGLVELIRQYTFVSGVISCGSMLAVLLVKRVKKQKKDNDEIGGKNDENVPKKEDKKDENIVSVMDTSNQKEEQVDKDEKEVEYNVSSKREIPSKVTRTASSPLPSSSDNNSNDYPTANTKNKVATSLNNNNKSEEAAAKQWAIQTLQSTQQSQIDSEKLRQRELEIQRNNQLWVENVALKNGITLPTYSNNNKRYIYDANGNIVWKNEDRRKTHVFNVVKEKEEREKRAKSLWVTNAMMRSGAADFSAGGNGVQSSGTSSSSTPSTKDENTTE